MECGNGGKSPSEGGNHGHGRPVGPKNRRLGRARGLLSKTDFRDRLADILGNSFSIEVININNCDDEGLVYGRLDQMELGILIKKGLLITCEIKSSMHRVRLYIFSRKVDSFERKQPRKANPRLHSPSCFDPRPAGLPEKLEIEVYGDPTQMPVY